MEGEEEGRRRRKGFLYKLCLFFCNQLSVREFSVHPALCSQRKTTDGGLAVSDTMKGEWSDNPYSFSSLGALGHKET